MAEAYQFFVIGCGSIGQRHIANLQTLGIADILAFDVRSDRRVEVYERFKVPTVDNLADGWKGNSQVTLITTPSSLHVPLAIEAAENLCHLFIEKPLGSTIDGIAELIQKVEHNHLKTMIGSNMRFNHGPATIKRLIDEGLIGNIISAHMDVGQYLPDWHPWEDYREMYSSNASMGGGVVLDGIHEIDLARWIFGEVDRVYAIGGTRSSLEIDTEDTVDILMRMDAGFAVSIHMDYVQRTYSRTSKIIGEEGTIVWDIANGNVQTYLAREQGWQSYDQPIGYDINKMYLDEMNHFLRLLGGENLPTLDIYEAKRVLEIALAVKYSINSDHSDSVIV